MLKFPPPKIAFFFPKEQNFCEGKKIEKSFLANLIIIWFFNIMESSKIK